MKYEEVKELEEKYCSYPNEWLRENEEETEEDILKAIKFRIKQEIYKTMLYKKTHHLDLSSNYYHIGTANGFMRALDIIKEVENDKNKQ